MEFSTLIEIFNIYGWPGILGLILVGIIYFSIKRLGNKMTANMSNDVSALAETLSKNISRQNEKLLTQINNQNDKLINFIIENNKNSSQYEKNQNIQHNQKLNERMNVTETINAKLKDIMNYTNSQRTAILEFHNTSQNLIGIPFAKFSINYEWFKRKIKPMQNKLKSVPFSMISSVVKDIIASDKNYIIYDNISDLINKNPALCTVLEEVKAQAAIFNAIYDDRNQFIGLLVVEFGKEIPLDIDLEQLDKDVIEISSTLNLHYKYNIL